MPEYRRSGVKGGTYFFTVTTYQRQPLLLEPTARAALCEAIESVNAKLSFTVEAWVLLSDHLHCLWTLPAGDADFPKRWGMIKRHVSRRCATTWNPPLSASRRHRHELGFWQRRYWEHTIRDEADYRRHIDYIHWNPVKHGLVQRAYDWPHSTFRRFVAAGVYTPDWGSAEQVNEMSYGE